MRRVACIALPEIRVEIAQKRENETAEAQRTQRLRHPSSASSAPSAVQPSLSSPLGVVIARRGGAVKTEREVLGNTRLDVVSRAARAAGIRAGQTVAAARAKHAGLR